MAFGLFGEVSIPVHPTSSVIKNHIKNEKIGGVCQGVLALVYDVTCCAPY